MPKIKEKTKIYPYSKDFPKLFKKKKEEILKLYEDCEINHIGSTAVKGLGGKGIIDILVAIDNWSKEDDLLEVLKELGYTHIHEREISFRDYLRENPKKAEEYFKIKKEAEGFSLSDYNEKKEEFFKKIKINNKNA